jgi:hypothetical protein
MFLLEYERLSFFPMDSQVCSFISSANDPPRVPQVWSWHLSLVLHEFCHSQTLPDSPLVPNDRDGLRSARNVGADTKMGR